MIEFDLTHLADAIFSGSHQDPAPAAAVLLQAGVRCPTTVAVIATDGRPVDIVGCICLHLHEGLSYVFARDAAALKRHIARHRLRAGDPVPCPEPGHLLRCLQRAITNTRRLEVRDAIAVPSGVAEHQARSLATAAFPEDLSAAQVWLDLVLVRHSHRLHAIQRKLIEFASLLTLPIERDHRGNLDRAFQAWVKEVPRLFTIEQIRRRVPELVAALAAAVPSTERVRSPLVRRALDLIHHHAHTGISAGAVAARLQVSGAHLARRFRAETGETPSRALQRARIARAQDLLEHSDADILHIALDVGFPSLEHFHRVFKRLTRTTPSRWRRSATVPERGEDSGAGRRS